MEGEKEREEGPLPFALSRKSYFLPPFLAAGFSAVLVEALAFGLVSAFFFISIYLWQSGIEFRRFAIWASSCHDTNEFFL